MSYYANGYYSGTSSNRRSTEKMLTYSQRNSYSAGQASSNTNLDGFAFGTSRVDNSRENDNRLQASSRAASISEPIISDTLYQVDFSASASGKHIAPTKRHIRFHFGFANLSDPNARGVECRGKEHIVELIWSLTTGKRIVLLDDHVIHSSSSKPLSHISLTDSRFQYLFPLTPSRGRGRHRPRHGDGTYRQRGPNSGNDSSTYFAGQSQGHMCKLVAHPFPPTGRDGITQRSRQFDLLVDGQSYFEMTKMFQLVGTGQQARKGFVGGSSNRGLAPVREEASVPPALIPPPVSAPVAAPSNQIPPRRHSFEGVTPSSVPALAPPANSQNGAGANSGAGTGTFGSAIAQKIDNLDIDLMTFDEPSPEAVGTLYDDDDDDSVWGNTYMPHVSASVVNGSGDGRAVRPPTLGDDASIYSVYTSGATSNIGGGRSTMSGSMHFAAAPTWEDYRAAFYRQSSMNGVMGGSMRSMSVAGPSSSSIALGNTASVTHMMPSPPSAPPHSINVPPSQIQVPQQQQDPSRMPFASQPAASPYQMNFQHAHSAFQPQGQQSHGQPNNSFMPSQQSQRPLGNATIQFDPYSR